MTSVRERQLRANDEEPKVQPEPLITSHHQPELKLAPNLPPPVLLVFRGFIAESAAGQMDSNWYPTSIPARLKASVRSAKRAPCMSFACHGRHTENDLLMELLERNNNTAAFIRLGLFGPWTFTPLACRHSWAFDLLALILASSQER